MSKEKGSNNSVGFTGLLTLAFIILKLCKVITWSWWWVLSPLLILVGMCILTVLGYIAIMIFQRRKKRRKLLKRLSHFNPEFIKDETEPRSKLQQRMEAMKANKAKLERREKPKENNE